MKAYLIFLLFLVGTLPTEVLHAQEDEIFGAGKEEEPMFPGGIEALYKYLNKNIVYPMLAKDSLIQGKVFVQFVIEKDGAISNVTAVKKIHPLLDNEATRVVSEMPKWIPATQQGEALRVRYTLPITFKIDGGENHTPKKTSEPKLPALEWAGKENTFDAYVTKNIKIPKEVKNSSKAVYISVMYEIDEKGRVLEESIKILPSPYFDCTPCEKEAHRLISKSTWKYPGEENKKGMVLVKFK